MSAAGVDTVIEELRRLREDFATNRDDWEHWDLRAYLEAIEAWLEATKSRAPAEPSWDFVASLFRVGKLYE